MPSDCMFSNLNLMSQGTTSLLSEFLTLKLKEKKWFLLWALRLQISQEKDFKTNSGHDLRIVLGSSFYSKATIRASFYSDFCIFGLSRRISVSKPSMEIPTWNSRPFCESCCQGASRVWVGTSLCCHWRGQVNPIPHLTLYCWPKLTYISSVWVSCNHEISEGLKCWISIFKCRSWGRWVWASTCTYTYITGQVYKCAPT